jgi:hypothetical protein
MISQRVALRTVQRLAARRAPAARGYATEEFKIADNAFNRDRAAVKAHAKDSASECCHLVWIERKTGTGWPRIQVLA